MRYFFLRLNFYLETSFILTAFRMRGYGEFLVCGRSITRISGPTRSSLTCLHMRILCHILFNMFGLWMFGRVLESVWGSKKFLLFYLVCGIGSAVAHMTVAYFQYETVLEHVELTKATGQTEYLEQFNHAHVMRLALPGQ